MTLGGLLTAAGFAYFAAVLMAYLEVTSPSSMLPELKSLERAFFGLNEKPVSPIERLLEATDGPMNGSGTMRPAFTEESVGWQSLTENMSADQKTALRAEREGERLALLDWVRSGPDWKAYERDDYLVSDRATMNQITADYVVPDHAGQHGGVPRRVRLRTLLNDRCVSCHSENGRNDKARSFPLDTYDNLEPHCRPEAIQIARPTWPIVSLLGLMPLALLSGPIFSFTSFSRRTRVALIALTFAALSIALGLWLLGRPGVYFAQALLVAAAVAAIGIIVQITASLGDLFEKEQS